MRRAFFPPHEKVRQSHHRNQGSRSHHPQHHGRRLYFTHRSKAKDGDFFISDWLRNRDTVEFLGIWETVHNPRFNSGEFAPIKSQAGLNSYKLSVKDWVHLRSGL